MKIEKLCRIVHKGRKFRGWDFLFQKPIASSAEGPNSQVISAGLKNLKNEEKFERGV